MVSCVEVTGGGGWLGRGLGVGGDNGEGLPPLSVGGDSDRGSCRFRVVAQGHAHGSVVDESASAVVYNVEPHVPQTVHWCPLVERDTLAEQAETGGLEVWHAPDAGGKDVAGCSRSRVSQVSGPRVAGGGGARRWFGNGAW